MTETNSTVETPGEDPKEINPEDLTGDEAVKYWQDKASYWKTHSRKNEQRFKDVAPLAEKWSSYEAEQKPKEQLLEEELNALKATLAQKDRDSLVSSIASELELPAGASRFITGNSEEEIREAALELKKLSAVKEEAPRTPAPNPLQGEQRASGSNLSALQAALKQGLNS